MSDHPHDHYAGKKHGHDHPDHAPIEDRDEGPPSEYEIMSRARQELLEEKGAITAEQVRRRMELFEEELPYRGSRVVAHAWIDPQFRKRLLDDGKAACAEFGIDLEADRLIAVENTPEVHNVIVCTLCSCYPRALLGMTVAQAHAAHIRARVSVDHQDTVRLLNDLHRELLVDERHWHGPALVGRTWKDFARQ